MEETKTNDETLSLGNKIELVGFSKIDKSTMVVVKKIVGNYVKEFCERMPNFEKIIIQIKPVHEREKSEIYEMHARILHGGKPLVADVSDRNLFYGIDLLMKKLENEAGHTKH